MCWYMEHIKHMCVGIHREHQAYICGYTRGTEGIQVWVYMSKGKHKCVATYMGKGSIYMCGYIHGEQVPYMCVYILGTRGIYMYRYMWVYMGSMRHICVGIFGEQDAFMSGYLVYMWENIGDRRHMCVGICGK